MARVGLALGGGGARGIAHVHVLGALDDLGVKPAKIVGSSIGAIIGSGCAAGLDARNIGEYIVTSFSHRRDLLAKLWQTRAPTFKHFMEDGGFRLGQLNLERIVAAFLPDAVPRTFEDLKIPLGVMATDYYKRLECELTSGDIVSAIAASSALPAVFRPVRREGRVLVDGGIYNPVPYDRLRDICDVTIAVDVNGGPEGNPALIPSTMEAMIGSSQLMMQAVIDLKVRTDPPNVLIRPRVSPYRVLEFRRAREILEATAPIREDAKRAIASAIEAHDRGIVTGGYIEVIGRNKAGNAHENSTFTR